MKTNLFSRRLLTRITTCSIAALSGMASAGAANSIWWGEGAPRGGDGLWGSASSWSIGVLPTVDDKLQFMIQSSSPVDTARVKIVDDSTAVATLLAVGRGKTVVLRVARGSESTDVKR